MGDTSHTTTKDPLHALESVWAKHPDNWLKRSYLTSTLTGVLHAFVRIAEQAGARHAMGSLPLELRQAMNWWPEELQHPIASWDDGHWVSVPDESVDGALVGDKVMWLVWQGGEGALAVVGHEVPAAKKRPRLDAGSWEIRISWDRDAVDEAFAALAGELVQNEGDSPSDAAFDGSANGGTCSLEAEILASLALADHYDPRARTEIVERTWIEMVNTVQYEVAWHLHSDRLLPAIGRAMDHCLGYDYIDIHVFNRLGSRYEEFLSWQDNRTGFGKELNIFVDKKIIKNVLEEGRPRLMPMEKTAGVLNPHLAELAGIQEGLLLPLVHEHKVQGVIAMYYSELTQLTDSDLLRIGRLGHVIARSIENSNAHEDMRLMASVDALTGLSNRRSFNDVIEKETHRSSRYRLPMSLILIDIDFFKTYNDTNGHLKGDYLLRDFAAILQKMVREEDTVARYGGEEFAIILPHTTSDNAHSVAEKIRVRVAETDFAHKESQPDKRITISLGVADIDGTVEDYRELIDQADKALYRAKETGRNRTITYSSDLASQRA